MPKLESAENALVHCNLVKNDYQHTSKVLFAFVPNKQLGKLVNISTYSLTMMNTLNTEFSSVVVCLETKLVKHLRLTIMLIWH